MNLNWLLSIFKSFHYAFTGIIDVIKRERNFRIHITVVYFVTMFSVVYGLSSVEYAVLFVTFFLVLAMEVVNTAVESVIDLRIYEENEYARLAKDAAAGGVLISAIGALAVAVFLFFDFEKLGQAVNTIFTSCWFLAFLLPLIPAIIFIKGSQKWLKGTKK